ncbi:hypothetical protein QM012_009584 [Aureobasidium pullulans]|uniref:Uncharacterized protein n=1 Tax=Aureobasidium pullulans TaxID=5580 RepID=A0ABR0TH96_AURPU
MKALPESSERSARIKDLEQFTKALDLYDFESCGKSQELIHQYDLEEILEMAEGELYVEGLIRSGLKRAESNPPKNENVARALSHFTGLTGEAEVKKLVATVTNKMLARGECNDPNVLSRNAEPYIIDLMTEWGSKEKEIKRGLVKLSKFNPALW